LIHAQVGKSELNKLLIAFAVEHSANPRQQRQVD
jgi:hypothetical protein